MNTPNITTRPKPFRQATRIVARQPPLVLLDNPVEAADRVGNFLLALERIADETLSIQPLAVRCIDDEHAILLVFVNGGRHWLTLPDVELACRAIRDERSAYHRPDQWMADLLQAATIAHRHLADCQYDVGLGRIVGWGERVPLRMLDGGLA